jgi:hypothetical protein
MKIRESLEQAYASLPHDFAYREVRFYLNYAIKRLEALERKEGKRVAEKQRQQQDRAEMGKQARTHHIPAYQSPFLLKQAISTIDEMIAGEYKKINEIQEKRNHKVVSHEPNNEDDDIQTLHG